MLEKSPGNFQVDKLQIILLFEANFNQLNKHIGWEMMHHTEQYRLVAGKQYCSYQRCSSITQSLNKHLAFGQIHQLKQAAIVFSNDAKSCYDYIIHWIAVQSMFQCGVHKLALVCMFTTIQCLQHHIRTLFDDSPNQHWYRPLDSPDFRDQTDRATERVPKSGPSPVHQSWLS